LLHKLHDTAPKADAACYAYAKAYGLLRTLKKSICVATECRQSERGEDKEKGNYV